MSQTRRLAAILAADVAGYSRLMGADEEGTHERLQVHRRELINPKISEHSGRIVKTTVLCMAWSEQARDSRAWADLPAGDTRHYLICR